MVANIRGYTPNYSFKLVNFDTPRWHTLEYANWNMVDAMFLQSGVAQIRGGWTNNTAYLEGDRVFDEDTSATYRCLITHTSAIDGTFTEDRIAHPAYWSLQLAGVPVFRDEWLPTVAYVLGDIVSVNDYTFYLCTVAHTSSVTFPPDSLFWQEVFDAAQVVIDSEAAKDAAYQFSLNAQDSANDAQSSANDAQSSEDDAAGWANDARAATGGFRWAYSSSTTAADPAIGRVAFNSANPLTVTELYLSAFSSEVGNPDVSDWVITWDDSTNVLTRGTLQLRKIGQPEQFMIFELKGNITDNGTWMLLPVAYITHSGTIINGEALSVGFVRAGNQGPTGTGGGDMLRANNLNDVVSIPNSRTNLGLGTAQIPTFSQVLLGNDPSAAMHAATKQYVDNSPSLVIGDVAPNPTTSLAGTLWWDSDLGTLYVLYSDGDSKQWVQAVATPGIDTTPLVKKAGDTMTGDLTINKSVPRINLDKTASGQNAQLVGQLNGSLRWSLRLGDNSAESGSDSGSAFALNAWSDAGVLVDTPLSIKRDEKRVTLSGDPTVALHAATKQYVDARALDVAAYSGMQINGGMEVTQELGGAQTNQTGTSNRYVMDGWSCNSAGGQTVYSQMIASNLPGIPFALELAANPGNAAPTAGQYCLFQQKIEGYRISRLAWGTANAMPITIAFWVYATRAGTYSGAVNNGTSSRSYAFPFTINANLTWERKVITIPGDTTGTWNTTFSIGMFIDITMMSGSTYTTAANTWVAGNFVGVTGTANGIANTNDRMWLTGVVVLPGTQAPTAAQSPLIMRPYDQELITCQRYYECRRYTGSGTDMNSFYQQANTYYFFWDFSVTKRGTPSTGAYPNNTMWAGGNIPSAYPSAERLVLYHTIPVAVIGGTQGNISYFADARL